MANKSFTVQYLIKAREQFASVAAKVEKATMKMKKAIDAANRATAKSSKVAKIQGKELAIVAVKTSQYSKQLAVINSKLPSVNSGLAITKSKVSSLNREFLFAVPSWMKFNATGNQSISMMSRFNAAGLRMQSNMRATEGRMEGITFMSEKMRNVGLGLTVAATLPFMMSYKAIKNAARDAQETQSYFEIIYGGKDSDIYAKASKAVAEHAKEFQLANTTAINDFKMVSDTLTGKGVELEEALSISKTVAKWAGDMVSAKNITEGTGRVVDAFVSQLNGENAAMKLLGININEKMIAERGLKMEMEGVKFKTMDQARSLAILSIALEYSKNTVDNYADTIDDLANKERAANEAKIKMLESYGKIIEPLAKVIANTRKLAFEFLANLSPAMQKTTLYIGLFFAVLGPVLLILGLIGLSIPIVTAGMAFLGLTTALTVSPFILAAAAVTLLVAGVILLTDNWSAVIGWLDKSIRQFPLLAAGILLVGLALAPFTMLIAAIAIGAVLIYKNWGEIKEFFIDIFDTVMESIDNAIDSLRSFEIMGLNVVDVLTAPFTALSNIISGEAYKNLFDAIPTASFDSFDFDAIKAEFSGESVKTVNQAVDVNMNVGLAEGLEQKGPASFKTNRGGRRTDVGANP